MIVVTESGVFGKPGNEILGDVRQIGTDTSSSESTIS
jgi:hypothetical protein